jgi:hypothetical protein
LAGLTEKIKDFVKKKGATLVGVATIERFSGAPKGHGPRDLLPNAKSVISIGLRINRSSILQLPKTMREYKMTYDVAAVKNHKSVLQSADPRVNRKITFRILEFDWISYLAQEILPLLLQSQFFPHIVSLISRERAPAILYLLNRNCSDGVLLNGNYSKEMCSLRKSLYHIR